MLEFKANIRVRYAETDAMGHVHHASYPVWFEVGRVEMLDFIGCSYKSIEATQTFSPVIELNLKLYQPAYFDDRLTLILQMKDLPKATFKIEYQVLRDQILLAEASSTHAFINKSGHAIRPPKQFLDHLKPFFQ